jgi:hypothetical protein
MESHLFIAMLHTMQLRLLNISTCERDLKGAHRALSHAMPT